MLMDDFDPVTLRIDEHLKTETNYTLTLKEISTALDRETKQATVRTFVSPSSWCRCRN